MRADARAPRRAWVAAGAALLVAWCGWPAEAGELRTWVDAEGRTHISDGPGPAGSTARPGEPKASLGSLRVEPDAERVPPAAPGAFVEGLLWRVDPSRRGARAVEPTYLFGTMHSGDARVRTLAPEVERTFRDSSTFCAEAALDGGALLAVGQRMFLGEGRTLNEILGAKLFERVAPLMAQRGMPPDFLPMLKPWVVLLSLGVPASMTGEGAGTILDVELLQKAQAEGKQICAIETLAEQIDSVEKIPERDQIAQIRAAADAAGGLEETYRSAIDLYVRGDLAGLAGLSESSSTNAETRRLERDLSRRLLDDRNVRMADRIAPKVGRGGAFIAIGAGHLGGDRGVLSLLARRGYQVVRVEPTDP